MSLLVLSLGFTIQTMLGQTHALQQIPQSIGNPNRAIDAQVDPSAGSSGNIMVAGKPDVSVNFGGNTAGTITNSMSVVRGLECGSTVQMYPRNSAQVFSTNFGVTNYKNNEACTWRFEANQCTLSAYCPCIDIPRSWECLGDYLKIRTDYVLQNQRFCGGNKPGQPIYSDTDFLSIRFRSDGKSTGAGFTCTIRCEAPGETMSLPAEITCPTSAAS